jgi:hypothetical protein
MACASSYREWIKAGRKCAATTNPATRKRRRMEGRRTTTTLEAGMELGHLVRVGPEL